MFIGGELRLRMKLATEKERAQGLARLKVTARGRRHPPRGLPPGSRQLRQTSDRTIRNRDTSPARPNSTLPTDISRRVPRCQRHSPDSRLAHKPLLTATLLRPSSETHPRRALSYFITRTARRLGHLGHRRKSRWTREKKPETIPTDARLTVTRPNGVPSPSTLTAYRGFNRAGLGSSRPRSARSIGNVARTRATPYERQRKKETLLRRGVTIRVKSRTDERTSCYDAVSSSQQQQQQQQPAASITTTTTTTPPPPPPPPPAFPLPPRTTTTTTTT